MKTLSKLLLFSFFFFLVACDKTGDENELPNSLSSIKDGKTLSGKITNFSGTEITKLKLIGEGEWDEESGDTKDELLAECNVTSNGEFSLTLKTPSNSNLKNIQDLMGGNFEGDISDKGAFVSNYDFLGAIAAYKGDEEIGYVFRGNSDMFEDWAQPPFSVSLLIYSDRKITIKGQDRSTENGHSHNCYYDFTLYKGWNEVVWKVLEYTSSKSSVSISNVNTDDMQWKFHSGFN